MTTNDTPTDDVLLAATIRERQANPAPGVPLDDLIDELGFSPSDFEGGDSAARRVWLLWDCEDLISAHATEAGAELAREEHTAKVRTDLGDEWAAGRNLHISVSWHAVQD